jgi:hypothetical protein
MTLLAPIGGYTEVPYTSPSDGPSNTDMTKHAYHFATALAAASDFHPSNANTNNGLSTAEKAQADSLASTLSIPKSLMENVFKGVIAMASSDKGKLTDEEIIRRIKGLLGPAEQALNARGLQRVLREIKENIPPDELANPLPPGEPEFKPDGTPSEFSSLRHDAAHFADTVYHAVTGFADSAGSAVDHHVAEATGLGVAGVVAGGIVTGAIDLGGVAAILSF